MPGIDDILGLTIMLEEGDIARFPKAGKYFSYCRCVKSERFLNKKKKGAATERTLTNILRGPMLKLPTLQSGITLKRRVSIIVKRRRRMGLWQLRH
jgi:hypothetical protein